RDRGWDVGEDLSQVRVHADGDADAAARSVGAAAYTVGSDVVFARDRYAPGTSEGRQLLAHELAHVRQQRQGPVSGTDRGDGVQVSDPSDAFEQEATHTAQIVAGRAGARPGPPPPRGTPAARAPRASSLPAHA